MSRQPSTPVRFKRAVNAAGQLPTPRELAARVMASTAGAHNGLRAASYEARVSGSRGGSSQPERVAERRIEGRQQRGERKPDGLDDLIAINRAGVAVLEAMASLLAEAADAGCPDLDDYTWDEALHDAETLIEPQHPDPKKHPDHDPRSCSCISLIEAADNVDRAIDVHIKRFASAVYRLRAIHRRYSRRAPSRYQQSGLKADEVCEFCALLRPPVYVERQGNLRGCRHCEDIRRKAGEYQPLELLQQYHDHRSGRITQTAYRRALSDWFQSVGTRPDMKGSCA